MDYRYVLTRKLINILLCSMMLCRLCLAGSATDSLDAIANKYFQQGDYDSLLETYLRMLELTEENSSCEENGIVLMKVSQAYYYLQQRETSLYYMRKAMDISRDCGIDSIWYMATRRVGSIYFEMAKPDSALLFLKEAESLLKETDDYGELSTLYSSIGDVYYHNRKDKSRSWNYYELAERYAIQSGNKNSMAFAYMKKGIFKTNEDDCKQGENYFNMALQLYKKMNIIEGIIFATHNIGWAQSECGKAEESYRTMVRVQRIKDSIFRKETATNAARYKTLYETEKKEKENLVLSRENALKKLEIANEIKSKRLQAIFFITTSLGLIIVFMYLYNRYKLKKQAELDSEVAKLEQMRFKAVIEAEENERKRIASDLHDGVGQLMSAAKMNLSSIKKELDFKDEEQMSLFSKAIALVDESCTEVRVVSHNMMPNVLLKSGLANAIRSFIGQIDKRVLNINLFIDGLNEKIDSNIEIVLYRVLQECVNNVIKHSGANHLDITLIKDDEGISATIEDNGKGFDTSIPGNFEGIGLKSIKSRISYLKGTVEWDAAPGKGTVVTVFVPVNS